jgi:hypothetical protein
MIATMTGRCAICSGRILKGRSRITNLGDRTVPHWAHESCADRDSLGDSEADRTHQAVQRRRMLRASSYAERSCPPD